MSGTDKVAFVFPGQGSQKVGMGRDLFDRFEPAREIFLEADRVLGFSLSQLCFEGPEDVLRQTVNAQPALLTMSVACYKAAVSSVKTDSIFRPSFLAGHSLGEYTALYMAGVLDFASAVHLARERGRLMHEAGQNTPGAMAAVLGLDEPAVHDLCRETGTSLANINCPGQLVISGPRDSIDRAVVLAKSRGALRALPLPVSGAFHSPLMQPAADGLASIIAEMPFQAPAVSVVANTSALPLSDIDSIKAELLQQLCSSVQWHRSVEFMIGQGVTTFIEIGAGNVLSGLIKRIDRSVKILNIGNADELDNIIIH